MRRIRKDRMTAGAVQSLSTRQQNRNMHMVIPTLRIIYIGGPTCMLDFGGVRLLTDPTFDPAGGEYTTGPVTLRKLAGPAVNAEDLGPFDYALLSHDHHFDNLDYRAKNTCQCPKSAYDR